MTNDDLTNEQVNDLREERKRIEVWLDPEDVDRVERWKREHGCSTATAIRGALRLADYVEITLIRRAPKNRE